MEFGTRVVNLFGNMRYSPADTKQAAKAVADGKDINLFTSHTTVVERNRLKAHREQDFKAMRRSVDILRRMGYEIPDTGKLTGFYKQCHPTSATIVQIVDNGEDIFYRTMTVTQYHKDMDRHGKCDSCMIAMTKLYGRRFRKLSSIPTEHCVRRQIPLKIIERVDAELAEEIKAKRTLAKILRSRTT